MTTKYYPVIKTTIAETRALKNLSINAWNNMTPILELTKSRKGKSNQDASVYKKIDELATIIKSDRFILDLTTIESLSNEQIESFYDDTDYFKNWCDFVGYVKGKMNGIIPVVLAYPDTKLNELLTQVENLSLHTKQVAIRIPLFEQGLSDLFNNIILLIQHKPYLIHSIIFDASYIQNEIDKKPFDYIISFISYYYNKISGFYSGNYVFCSEHYPGNIVDYLEKSDDKYDNSVSYRNYDLFNRISLNLGAMNISNIKYGDYACIHPFRNDVRAYNWIPRIDYPTRDTIFFSKVRRDVGGYEQCAKNIVRVPEFQKDGLRCWGMNEIIQASQTKPGGLNPSYWISVRSNIHMSRMANISNNA